MIRSIPYSCLIGFHIRKETVFSNRNSTMNILLGSAVGLLPFVGNINSRVQKHHLQHSIATAFAAKVTRMHLVCHCSYNLILFVCSYCY